MANNRNEVIEYRVVSVFNPGSEPTVSHPGNHIVRELPHTSYEIREVGIENGNIMFISPVAVQISSKYQRSSLKSESSDYPIECLGQDIRFNQEKLANMADALTKPVISYNDFIHEDIPEGEIIGIPVEVSSKLLGPHINKIPNVDNYYARN